MNMTVILAAIQAGVSLIPEGKALIDEITSLFSTSDVDKIKAAHDAAVAAAAAQHDEAQSL